MFVRARGSTAGRLPQSSVLSAAVVGSVDGSRQHQKWGQHQLRTTAGHLYPDLALGLNWLQGFDADMRDLRNKLVAEGMFRGSVKYFSWKVGGREHHAAHSS